jgi:predicted DNA-binding transcriptional regulator AlpA
MTRARIEPRGLHRDSAALYVGVGLSKFTEMVGDGRMPKPKIIDSRRVWDRYELDAAFNDLPHDAPVNEWDSVLNDGPQVAVR